MAIQPPSALRMKESPVPLMTREFAGGFYAQVPTLADLLRLATQLFSWPTWSIHRRPSLSSIF